MARRLRIPGVVDMLRTDDPAEILALAADPRLDRRFEARGPLVNRLLAKRIRRVLSVEGVPLPPVAPRDEPGREEERARTEARTEEVLARGPCDPALLLALAVEVGARSGPNAFGPLAQTAIGELFVPGYRASAETWRAARDLDAAVRDLNPFRSLARALSGRTGRARRLLTTRAQGNLIAVHATGIAVHNLVRAFGRMADLAARPGALARYAPEEAATICLEAPESVLRQAVAAGTTAAGFFRPGTLVAFDLEAARAASLRPDVTFLTGGWSRCPAHAWVPALLAAVWRRAAQREGIEQPGPGSAARGDVARGAGPASTDPDAAGPAARGQELSAKTTREAMP